MTTILHERSSAQINSQSSSPLYNGRIPSEIRSAIFKYALTEYLIPARISAPKSATRTTSSWNRCGTAQVQNQRDISPSPTSVNLYKTDSHFARPGYTGRKKIDIGLLQTCWRVYLETYHLPPAKKEHVFWHARGPPGHKGRTLSHSGEQEYRYFDMFLPWQMSYIKELHLFTQLFWLEDVFPRMAGREFMQGMEKIKLTIRRGDWWHWEQNVPLAISPQSGHRSSEEMHEEWRLEVAGRRVYWNPDSWGCAFKKMRNLKEIEIEFETSDDKLDELQAIVDHTKHWQFSAWSAEDEADMVLKCNGICKWSKWNSPPCYWSSLCPHCGNGLKCVLVEPVKPGCLDRTRRRNEDAGPLCHIALLGWRRSKED